MELSAQPGLLLWTLLTFGVLLLLLSRFAFKPLRKILDQREEAVRGSLEKAQKAGEDAERVLAENEKRLDQAREETRKIINEGHKIVVEMKREAQKSGKREAELIVSQARSEIDRELQKSLRELKGTVANLSVRIARNVIKERLDEKHHEELVDDFIERLKKSHAMRRS